MGERERLLAIALWLRGRGKENGGRDLTGKGCEGGIWEQVGAR